MHIGQDSNLASHVCFFQKKCYFGKDDQMNAVGFSDVVLGLGPWP
jgi:hypothetical protein